MNTFYNSVALFIGEESLEEFVGLLRTRHANANRILLLTRGGEVEKSPSLEPLMGLFSDNDTFVKEITLFNPDVTDILRLKQEIEAEFDFELIVAIGGGSVMDVAKTLSALKHQTVQTTADVRESIKGELYREEIAFTPWVGIPTTSGTGSEVTCWATVWDEERGCKYSVSDERLYASAAAILPELSVTMPLRLSVSTALDALCHATEAYWSNHTNDITRIYALEAIERICRTLPLLIEQPTRLAWREQLSLASMFAGLAFSNTKTTACHSISYPLTLHYGIDHGIAVSITLAAVMRHNMPGIIEPDKLLHAFGASNVDEVEQCIRNIYKIYGLPSKLSEYGITPDGIPSLITLAYTKGRMDNNPIEITERDLQDILMSLL